MSVVRIGPYSLSSPLILAPMAGITDRPFRQLCQRWGAGMTVSEMVTSDVRLWNSRKSRLRLCHEDDPEPRAVQIAGSDPVQLAEAARQNVALGAQIIDINMGCPARKVCNKAAGSALMKDEPLVAAILSAVVAAVSVPVTLKMRTGWDHSHRNGPEIARIAEDCGVAAIAVHGRTRADLYQGEAEYDTIAQIKQQRRIPVFANGDIDSPIKAQQVLKATGADALLIGRGAQGRPWIFREIAHYLQTGQLLTPPTWPEITRTLYGHLEALYAFYGHEMGARIARKHVGWYLGRLPNTEAFRARFNQLADAVVQQDSLRDFFTSYQPPGTATGEEIAPWQ